jgi:hypothetical protein
MLGPWKVVDLGDYLLGFYDVGKSWGMMLSDLEKRGY